ncbi:cation transporter [Pseudoduganella sp. SL102]|uniref:cation transporter n=1 Tax=Pseudoduganella sp. SL102 TaxID=2995154 RepID=UPI00248C700C|nr:cation transporter [Pseudoduganella sp. SL102]WBS04650.1 cation transporter [Pseudoduganella sp. SL102]
MVQELSFDLSSRELRVVHTGDVATVVGILEPLKLGARVKDSVPLAADATDRAFKSIFSVPKMDCPSEERLIRMALEDRQDIRSLSFDLAQRELTVIHLDDVEGILGRLQPLGLGAVLSGSSLIAGEEAIQQGQSDDVGEAKALRLLLAINAVMFVFELALGLWAQSAGLLADSLDMFADAAVYGLALYAVGKAASMKTRAAHLAGWLQLLLALGALAEVVRRFVFGSDPESALMMGVGMVALVANVACLMLIAKKRDSGVHMRASYIFSANDVIANLGVIVAGVLVAWTGSSYPDLIIGTVIAVVVLNGARRILRLR